MNAFAGPPPTRVGDELVGRYEDLRRHIIEGVGSRPRLGLTVLLREGLAAWIITCATTATAMAPARDPSDGAALRLADDGHADLVHVLAAMVLHRFDRREAP
ncbi:MAG: hypothetical protein HY002_20455 [Candidatus Rokubacteria bacterium]|nr:hypothetical protein [Candidatus Rokubacteria bacterium]